jgi:hypothetical protein
LAVLLPLLLELANPCDRYRIPNALPARNQQLPVRGCERLPLRDHAAVRGAVGDRSRLDGAPPGLPSSIAGLHSPQSSPARLD